ncbi:DegV family protein [uncultured Anaerococcus sp.]|uniref:DegV family protein n=1 Tax=uncultured Anaerococcus sp. TaxID=293428 RepID=UPI00288BB968|nr:DegV family protein [uncultured Anaerococcus sp.]
MEKIAILVDSAGDLPLELIEKEGFYLLPLYVNLDGKFLRDRIDISPDEFYDWVRSKESLPKTSMPSPGDIQALLEKIRDYGYDKLIAISIGSKYSGTFNALNLAEIEGLDVFALNTGNLTLAEGLFAVYAKKLIEDGKTFAEIRDILSEKIYDSKVFFTIDSFKYIVEGGRVPKSFAKIGDVLSVKPIVKTSQPEGGFEIVKIVRGEKKVFRQLEKIADQYLANAKDYYMFICHGGYEEGLIKLRDLLKDYIDRASLYIEEQISPTLGANTGPGLFGFGFFILD